MGGRGRSQWDGVPMSTLMRRALEECATLEQVKELWRTSPRTCEYFYVFADGKPRGKDDGEKRAVGVSATPHRIEFLAPGQDHAQLGKGIADTVLLSAGRPQEARASYAAALTAIASLRPTQRLAPLTAELADQIHAHLAGIPARPPRDE